MTRSLFFVLASVLALAAPGCRPLTPTAGTPALPGEGLTLGISRSQHVFGTRPYELQASAGKVATDVAALIGPSDRLVRVDLIGPHNASSLPQASFGALSAQFAQALRSAARRQGLDLRSVPSRAAGASEYELVTYVIGGIRPDGLFFVDWSLVKR